MNQIEKGIRGCRTISINVPDELGSWGQPESLYQSPSLSNGILELKVRYAGESGFGLKDH